MEPLSKEEALEALLGDVEGIMEELCQSGFDTLHDSTLEGLQELAEVTEQYGMGRLSRMLDGLARGLGLRRHQMERARDGMAGLYAEVIEYLYLCREKIACDRARGHYAT